jgi:maltose phosphorylase
LNSPNWIGIDVQVHQEYLDLGKCKVDKFRRILNMKEGYLQRSFEAILHTGQKVRVEATRFLSMHLPEIGIIRYSVTPLNFSGEISLLPYIDGDVKNEDSNYNEKFWDIIETAASNGEGCLVGKTKKLDFGVGFAMKYVLTENGKALSVASEPIKGPKYTGNMVKIEAKEGSTITLYKYVAVVTSLDHPADKLAGIATQKVRAAFEIGYDKLFDDHKTKWKIIWNSDSVIKGILKSRDSF